MNATKNLVLFGVVVLGSILLSANTVYTWTDENGVVHYSQTAPEENPDQAKQTVLRSAPKTGGTFVEVAPESEESETSAENSGQPAATPKQEDAYQKVAANCERAREMLANLDTDRQLRLRDPVTGEVTYATAEDLAVQRERALAAIEKDC